MAGLRVNFDDRREVEINGKTYPVKRSAFEVYAIGKEALKRCAELQSDSADSVRGCIDWMCRQVDVVLGVGAMYEISGGAPVNIESALMVLNYIATACGREYADYVKHEYVQPKQA